jgi:formylglycine-generating enzyme required for sulfatase activity
MIRWLSARGAFLSLAIGAWGCSGSSDAPLPGEDASPAADSAVRDSGADAAVDVAGNDAAPATVDAADAAGSEVRGFDGPLDAPGVDAGADASADACSIAADMPMLPVAGGTFMMGSTIFDDTTPIHVEAVAAFAIDATEVTTAAYTTCVAAGACTAPPMGTETGICNFGVCSRQSHPINCVDFGQATAFCAWAGKRLPTETEWEYAARGPDDRTYPWGAADPTASLVNAYGTGDGWVWTAPVASFPAGRSPFGAYDMAGNVAEWTASLYCPYDGSPCTSTMGVLRGGDFTATGSGLDPAGRLPFSRAPGSWASGFGFRCAR